MIVLTSGGGGFLVIYLLLAAALCGTSIYLMLRLRKLEARLRRFMRGKDGASLEKSFAKEFSHLHSLESENAVLRQEVEELKAFAAKYYSRIGIVKYDAFEDVGGKMSFVLAMLNEEDSGIVVNAIHSKDNCFLYLKEIVGGESYIILSKEEIEALQAAKRNGEDLEAGIRKTAALKREQEAQAEAPRAERHIVRLRRPVSAKAAAGEENTAQDAEAPAEEPARTPEEREEDMELLSVEELIRRLETRTGSKIDKEDGETAEEAESADKTIAEGEET